MGHGRSGSEDDEADESGLDSVLREVARLPHRALPLQPGTQVMDRFVIERRAGAGGMGVIYRATDRVTGEAIALKVMASAEHEGADRFSREARMLAELAHPGVVRYVAHGVRGEGEAYLAMEWLDGEDLAARLRRAPLEVGESIAVASRAADALGHAHARGAVHRDVKPSNIFLVDGDPGRAKVLDFGLARPALASRALTASGAVLGTVGYMAPEQARGERDVDARADVFSLGCVLFECLTGRPAFLGEHVVAVLAKVLLEEAPRLAQLRPDLPASLDGILSRMLAKDRAARPLDGGEVARALAEITLDVRAAAPAHAPARGSLTEAEQRIVSVVLVETEPPHDGSTIRLSPADLATDAAVDAIVAEHRAAVSPLASGALLVTMAASTGTLDGAARAASLALALRDALPAARLALATGRAQSSGHGVFGPVIDRAARLLARRDVGAGSVRIDELTRGLLEGRFDVRERDGVLELVGRRATNAEVPRTLLGKPTPCVGRERELAILEATLTECLAEPVARAVLVTAPPGTGKSRLRLELVERARRHGDLAVLVARADPVGAGASLGLVRQLVRAACGLREGDPLHEQQARLATALGRRFDGGRHAHVLDFLGELVGAPPREPCPTLRAARNDLRLMGEWMRRSFEEWIDAECAARPLLFVIEDLHWGDLPSVSYLDGALRRLRERPFMLLALARPEVHDLFPRLWAGAGAQEIRLDGLTRRAAERLVRALLDDAAPETIARIVERADGNAYYLEELIRRVAEGGSEELPDTVIAMAASRLERLEPEARRILRAASVFGETFWQGGVAALLGVGAAAGDVPGWLDALTDREVVSPAGSDRFPGERAFAFRHGLSREAAYAMLTDADQRNGHRLAGDWLERAGEKDPRVLADHFERGGEPERAVPWLVEAARAAVRDSDVQGAIALIGRGIACGARGEARGELLALRGNADAFFLSDMRGALDHCRQALELLPRGGPAWFVAAAWLVFSSMHLGDPTAMMAVLSEATSPTTTPAPTGSYGLVMYSLVFGLSNVGQRELSAAVQERAEETARRHTSTDRIFDGYLRLGRMLVAANVRGHLGDACRWSREALALLWDSGDSHAAFQARHFAAWIQIDAGRFDVALELAAPLLPDSDRAAREWGTVWTGKALAYSGRPAEAVALLEPVAANGNRLVTDSARAFLAVGHLAAGQTADAEREARAVAAASVMAAPLSVALSVLARIELAAGRPREALAAAERGIAAYVDGKEARIEGSVLRLAKIEALQSLGEHDAARVALREARERILRIAGTLDDPDDRAAYVANIEANALTLALAGYD